MELICWSKCVYGNVCVCVLEEGWRLLCFYLWDITPPSPQPPPSDQSFFIRYAHSSTLWLRVELPEPGYLSACFSGTALTSFCMARGHKRSLLMLSAALSGVWTTAEPDPRTPQAGSQRGYTEGRAPLDPRWPVASQTSAATTQRWSNPGAAQASLGDHMRSAPCPPGQSDKHTRPHASSV